MERRTHPEQISKTPTASREAAVNMVKLPGKYPVLIWAPLAIIVSTLYDLLALYSDILTLQE
jgi:hypothetical protein